MTTRVFALKILLFSTVDVLNAALKAFFMNNPTSPVEGAVNDDKMKATSTWNEHKTLTGKNNTFFLFYNINLVKPQILQIYREHKVQSILVSIWRGWTKIGYG